MYGPAQFSGCVPEEEWDSGASRIEDAWQETCREFGSDRGKGIGEVQTTGQKTSCDEYGVSSSGQHRQRQFKEHLSEQQDIATYMKEPDLAWTASVDVT